MCDNPSGSCWSCSWLPGYRYTTVGGSLNPIKVLKPTMVLNNTRIGTNSSHICSEPLPIDLGSSRIMRNTAIAITTTIIIPLSLFFFFFFFSYPCGSGSSLV